MFTKILLFSATMLFVAFYNANALTLNCGTMTPADCKKEFGVVMDKEIRTKFVEMMKMQMMKTMSTFSKVKDEMPADSIHAKILMGGIEDIKTQMAMLDNMDGMSVEDMGHLWQRCLISMHPKFNKAQKEDSANAEKFKESMIKHGWSLEMELESYMMMMKDFERMCMELLNGLRSEDFKEYPEYMAIKELLQELKVSTGNRRVRLFLRMIRKLSDLTEIPFMKALVSTLFII